MFAALFLFVSLPSFCISFLLLFTSFPVNPPYCDSRGNYEKCFYKWYGASWGVARVSIPSVGGKKGREGGGSVGGVSVEGELF